MSLSDQIVMLDSDELMTSQKLAANISKMARDTLKALADEGERKVAIETGWIGANTKEQAEEILQTKFPGGRIIRVYEKISGMFAYEIDMPDKRRTS